MTPTADSSANVTGRNQSDKFDSQTSQGSVSSAVDIQEARRAFGRQLKSYRENAGQTIESVALATRIARPFVVALEDGAFEKLPGRLFGRGFVQSIARVVNAPEKELVQAYLNCSNKLSASVPSGQPTAPVHHSAIETRPRELVDEAVESEAPAPRLAQTAVVVKARRDVAGPAEPSRRNKRLVTWVGAGLAAMVLVGIGLWMIGRKSSVEPGEPVASNPADLSEHHATENLVETPVDTSPEDIVHQDPPADAAAVAGVAPVELLPGPPAAQPAAPSVTAAATPSPPPAVATSEPAPAVEAAAAASSPVDMRDNSLQTLQLVVKTPVKIKIGIDTQAPEVKELAAEQYEFTFKDRADLMVYDAAAVDIKFNGRSLGSLGSAGRIRRLSFSSPQAAHSALPPARQSPQ